MHLIDGQAAKAHQQHLSDLDFKRYSGRRR